MLLNIWLRLFGTIFSHWIEAEKKQDSREERGATKVEHLWACSTFMVISNDLNSTFDQIQYQTTHSTTSFFFSFSNENYLHSALVSNIWLTNDQCKFKKCFIVDWCLFLFVCLKMSLNRHQFTQQWRSLKSKRLCPWVMSPTSWFRGLLFRPLRDQLPLRCSSQLHFRKHRWVHPLVHSFSFTLLHL